MKPIMQELCFKNAPASGRLDAYVALCVPSCSRTYLSSLIKNGCVLVDGKTSKPSYKLRGGETINVSIPEPEELDAQPQDIPLSVIFEDSEIIVINKPAGMCVHPAHGHTDETLVNALLHHCAGNLSGIGGVLRPGIVHRLDMNTSGVMVAAKTDIAHRNLSDQFKARTTAKEYLAITHRVPSPRIGNIDLPIGHDKRNPTRRAIRTDNGRDSFTHYKVLATSNANEERTNKKRSPEKYAAVACFPKTGRTHQIRVHLKSLKTPILADPTYGHEKEIRIKDLNNSNDETTVLSRHALHARHLNINHPITNERLTFSAEIPPDMLAVLTHLNIDMEKI